MGVLVQTVDCIRGGMESCQVRGGEHSIYGLWNAATWCLASLPGTEYIVHIALIKSVLNRVWKCPRKGIVARVSWTKQCEIGGIYLSFSKSLVNARSFLVPDISPLEGGCPTQGRYIFVLNTVKVSTSQAPAVPLCLNIGQVHPPPPHRCQGKVGQKVCLK